jgi:hypothetical protein
MASTSSRKHCANGDDCKQSAAALCEGCSKALCTKHFIDHRRLLGEELNLIITEHDQFQQTLDQQKNNSDSHPSIKQINEWENESIVRIQQKAKELREQLLQLTIVHLDDISKKLRNLSETLQEGREHDSFVETDLQQWKKTIDDLKSNFDSPSTFSISRHNENPLVQNISVDLMETTELFERVFDNRIRIEDNGQVAIHDATNNYSEIRGKNVYESGRHRIRLRIEQSTDSWTLLGINSESALLQNRSFKSKSAYGWVNNNFLWLNGECQPNKSTARIEMKTNDTISLLFDCDNHKISMTNERTNAKYELPVNIDHCPFPWQLHVNLSEPNSRVRILTTSS